MKKTILLACISFICALGCSNPQPEEIIHFETDTTQTVLIQLFTSQGCSSCPPAVQWLSTFKKDKQLWGKIVPVAFHVDYWNSSGWHDPFSSQHYTLLQQGYEEKGVIESLYTPCFVLNGNEWKGWFSQEDLRLRKARTGVMKGSLRADRLEITYSDMSQPLELHIAILGFGLKTSITSGENRDTQMVEDFVVLQYENFISQHGKWLVQLRQRAGTKTKKRAIALWICRADDPVPLQATGAWLPEKD
jgi:hypothetical protein